MIILKSIGGLGNQMFQIAFARSLSLEYSKEVYIDTSVYDSYKIRDFSLSNLLISEHFDDFSHANLPIRKRIYFKLTQKIYHVVQKIIKVLFKTDKIGKALYDFCVARGLYYNFDVYYYDHIIEDKDFKCLYGYFQSEQYFSKYKDQIVNELKVKVPPTGTEKALLDEILTHNSVAVSMRLGDDYIKSSMLNVCSDDYYIKGIKYISNKYSNAKIYIFSDDIERAKKIINGKFNAHYVEGFKDYQSLRLLYSCKHFVISNSSFSWWGAYLSFNTDKIIVAPSRWYNNSRENPAIYTNDMVLIDV